MILNGEDILKCCANCQHVEGEDFTSRYDICVCGREKDRRVNRCAGAYCPKWEART
jgi:hypothetical protein